MSTQGRAHDAASHQLNTGSRAAFRLCGVGFLVAVLNPLIVDAVPADDGGGSHRLRAVLVTAEMATDVRLQKLRNSGYSAAVLMLSRTDKRSASTDRQAVERIGRSGLDAYYWIEVGRCPELADAHPRCMAILRKRKS